MNVQLVRNDDGVLEAQCDAPQWQQGEQLIRHLKKHFDARVIEKAEGPDARSWSLQVAGKEIVVHQWDTGDINFFAKDATGESLMEKLANSVKAGVE
ncbi:MAG TPA: DUF3630 family protein [Verrucomicrobiota bacterium]|nr:DUF3630 family protein [Verrucomicrobiota bacterium]